MNNQGLGSWIQRRAKMTPWKTAIVFEDQHWTYSEFQGRITRLAYGLRNLGVRHGDRVAYLGQNNPAFLETMFATGTLGAVFVPLNFRFSTEDLAYIIKHAGCDVLVYDSEAEKIIDAIRPGQYVRDYVAVDKTIVSTITLESIRENQTTIPIDEYVGLNELCLISYTSGTTGRPKGVMLSHKNLTWNVFNFLSCSDFISDDVILTLAPLYRLGGLGVTVLPGLFKGATIVVTPETEPAEILDLIERHRVTVLFGAPASFQDLLDVVRERKSDLSTLRFCICGGDTIPEQLVRDWLALGVQFQQGYGLTEAAPMALLLDKHEMITKNGSAGRSPFFTEVRVVNSDMADVQAGENGEIVVRGPNVMMGYWNDPELTDITITDNEWLHTGDAAQVDSEGHIYISGRIKDAITLGNDLKVFPSEIEKVLIKYPDVVDCAVAGILVDGGSVVVAFLVLSADATNSVEQFKIDLARELPPEKVPQHYQFINRIPRNPNGKILRRKLLELYTTQQSTIG